MFSILSFLTFTLSIADILVTAQNADRAFLFCIQGDGAKSPGTVALSSQPSSSNCAEKCAAVFPGQISYSYYQSQTLKCSCSTSLNNRPKRVSRAGQGNAECQNPNFYSIYLLATTFRYDQCYQAQSSSNTPSITTSDIEECFNLCRSSSTLVIQPQTSSGTSAGVFICSCPSPEVTFSNPSACDPLGTTYYRYTHSPIAVASMLVRRRVQRRLSKPQSFCPEGLTACSILGISTSYECIDTSSELEACGGCGSAGEFGIAAPVSIGINCMTQPGAAWGTTCLKGKCVN